MIKLKRNKKGFTLIELLATVAIIGVIMAISIVGVTTYISKSEEKANLITNSNVLNVAQSYVKEYYSNNNWYSITKNEEEDTPTLLTYDKDNEKTCVSIDQLIAKGYISKKTNKQNYNYVILKRNKDSKTIISKELAESIDDTFCSAITIKPPKLIKKIEYTDHITATYEISNEVDESIEDIPKREINSYVVKVDNENVNDSNLKIVKSDNISEDYLTELTVDIDGLYDNKEYEIELKVDYTIGDGTNSSEQETNTIDKITTKELKSPTIEYDKKSKEKKEINFYVDQKNIYGDFTFMIIEGSYETNRESTSYITYNQQIFGSDLEYELSDNTNKKSGIAEIDNYYCRIIEENNKNLKLKVYNNYNEIDGIDEKLKYFTIKGDFTKEKMVITPNQSATYSAEIEYDEKEDPFRCDYDFVYGDPSEDDLNITIKKEDGTELEKEELSNNWYNQNIIFNIQAKNKEGNLSENSIISFKLDNYEKINTENNDFSYTITDTGNHKFIVYLTDKDGNSLKSKTFYVNIDKIKPELNIVINKKDCTSNCQDMESDFKNNSKWKNYQIRLEDFTIVDAHSGAYKKVERIPYNINTKKCEGTVSTQNLGTYSTDLNLTSCFRTYDLAGNVSDWSEPYYFKVDTIAPEITIGAYKNTAGKNLTYDEISGLEKYETSWYNNNVFTRIEKITNNLYSDKVGSGILKTGKLASLNGNIVIDESYNCSEYNCQEAYQNVTAEGKIKIRYYVYDEAGNYSYKDLLIGIDKTPPTFEIYMNKAIYNDKSVLVDEEKFPKTTRAGYDKFIAALKNIKTIDSSDYPSYSYKTSSGKLNYYSGNVLVYPYKQKDTISGIKVFGCQNINTDINEQPTENGGEVRNLEFKSEIFVWSNIYLKGINTITCIVGDNAGNITTKTSYVLNDHIHDFGNYANEKRNFFKNYTIENYRFNNYKDQIEWTIQTDDCYESHGVHTANKNVKGAFLTCIHCGKTAYDLGYDEYFGHYWCPVDYNEQKDSDDPKISESLAGHW